MCDSVIKTAFDQLLDKYRSLFNSHPLLLIFITSTAIFLVIFFIMTIITQGQSFSDIFVRDKNDTFMDYFNSVMYSYNHPYTKYNVIYPPLVTLFYGIIGTICVPAIGSATLGNNIAFQLRNSQNGLMVFCIITIITLVVLYKLIGKKIAAQNQPIKDILSLIVILSFPFIFCIERGNSVLWAIDFSLLFVFNYNSENKYKRLFSYVCLGIVSGIKLYCLLYFLLILREKNIKEIAVCIPIVVSIMVIPFVFTDGTIFGYIMSSFNSTEGLTHSGGSLSNVRNMLAYFDLDSNVRTIILYGLYGLLYGICLIVTVFIRDIKLWKILCLITCALTLGLGTGAVYNLCFFVVPLIFFFNEESELTLLNLIYVILFVMLFSLIPPTSLLSSDVVDNIHLLPMFIFELLLLFDIIIKIKGDSQSLRE